MIEDKKHIQWWVDFIFPLFISVGVIINAKFVYDQQTLAATLFKNSVWFLWSWIALLFFSNIATLIGVILRRFDKLVFRWFEYPGSIAAGISVILYSGILFIGNPGPAALSIAVTLVIGAHYIKNFLIIFFQYFK